MKDLNEFREQINIIDKQIATLFEERMKLSADIAEYKKKNNLDIFDRKREEEVISRNISFIQDDKLKEYYQKLLIYLMNLSKEYQNKLINDDDVITVNTSLDHYDIILKKNSLNDIDKYFNLNRKVFVLVDKNIPQDYVDLITSKCLHPIILHLKVSEKIKSLTTCKQIWNIMLENEFNRHDCLISCGGGIIGDIGGFVASTYMRGIDFYNIPTTVLSQVDSSIGGKTAINFDGYKNIIGSFYSPQKVLIDLRFLDSLDMRQINNGLVEALKMSILCDKELFETFENTIYLNDMQDVVYRSLLNKRKIVQFDEKERGIRKILNFGHTIGHGIEALNMGLYHGECVALGMLALCSDELHNRLLPLYKLMNLPKKIDFDSDKVLKNIMHDKKSIDDGIEIIFVNDIEKYEIKKVNIDYLYNRLELIKRGRQ